MLWTPLQLLLSLSREFPLWWGDGRSHVELHQVKNLTALSMYVRLCPNFRELTTTTFIQLNNPLSTNPKKIPLHKLFIVKGLQKAENLVTFSMSYGQILPWMPQKKCGNRNFII